MKGSLAPKGRRAFFIERTSMKTIVVNVTGDSLADYIQVNASTIEFAFSSEPPMQNGFDTTLINDPSVPGGVGENLVPHMEGGSRRNPHGRTDRQHGRDYPLYLCPGLFQ